MSDGSLAEFVSFERFLERRRRLARPILADSPVPPASTDPANSSSLDNEPRAIRAEAVAAPLPEGAGDATRRNT
jgi:hypothetical protein